MTTRALPLSCFLKKSQERRMTMRTESRLMGTTWMISPFLIAPQKKRRRGSCTRRPEP